MLRVVVRYKDNECVDKIKKYGNIIYQSKLMKVLGIETSEPNIKKIKKIPGVLSIEKSEKGSYLPIKACT